MKHRIVPHRFVFLTAFVLLLAPLRAQSVAAPPNQPLKPADAELIELSPFVVNTSRDTGYQATSTLAGTRLNTPVNELAASISIYTKDLMDDLGATSSSDPARPRTPLVLVQQLRFLALQFALSFPYSLAEMKP